MNETMLQARLCERVVPVGRGADALLHRMQETSVPRDPAFVSEATSSAAHGTLYLALDDRGMEALRAKILLSSPWDIDAGDFEKIYRRLYHLPWIIGTTPRLLLREMMLSDIPALYALYDGEAKRYLPPLSDDPEEEKKILRAYIEKVYGLMGYGYWAVIERKTGELVGRAGFGVPAREEDPAELGYVIRRDKREKGYAEEAVQAAIDYERRMLCFPGVIALTEVENIPSRRLLVSLGFRELPRQKDGLCRYAL